MAMGMCMGMGMRVEVCEGGRWDRGVAFRKKVEYLETLKVNPSKAFLLNPGLRSAPLSSVKRAAQSLSSLGLGGGALGRILDSHPVLLTLEPYTELYPLVDFLLHEVPIPFPHIHLSLSRCPRLLVSSVPHQLRPTLHFLRKLGFRSLTPNTTLLLVSSVPRTLLPKIRFFTALGLSHRQLSTMLVRSPALLTYSIPHNLLPKLHFFFRHMNGDVAHLRIFPQYFSFSLDRRIRPRFLHLRRLGLSMPLERMLKLSDGAFHAALLELSLAALPEQQRLRF